MNSVSRTNLFLAGVLLLQIILLLVLPHGGTAGPTISEKDRSIAGTKPFSGLDEKAVRSVSIVGEGDKSLRLESETKKEGDKETTSWKVASRDGYPARTEDCNRIVEAVKKITLSRVITRQEKRYAGLNVADGVCRAKVTLGGDGGKTLADLYVGDTHDATGIYVRVAGDPAVYQASGAAAYDFPTTVNSLVDTKFSDTPVESIETVKITAGADSYELKKEKPASVPASQPTDSKAVPPPPAEAKWVTVGAKPETLDKTKVENWLRSIGTLYLAEPIGKAAKPEFGFDKPTAVAVIGTADGKQLTITIGAERKDERDYYAQVSGKDYIVTIGSYNVTDYFQKKLKDLMPGATGGDTHDDHDHGEK